MAKLLVLPACLLQSSKNDTTSATGMPANLVIRVTICRFSTRGHHSPDFTKAHDIINCW
jgi:hypothetical protein